MPPESARFRKQRHTQLLARLAHLPRPLSILDVGGTARYWLRYGMPQNAQITVINLSRAPSTMAPGFRHVQADACAMPQFSDGGFDVVFSNSVIEPVGDWIRQQAMAAEIARGPRLLGADAR